MKYFLSTIFLLSLCVINAVDPDVLSFCQSWFPDTEDTCVSEASSSIDFTNNALNVKNRQNSGDCNVGLSYYMLYSRSYFEEHMTMSSPALPIGNPAVTLGEQDYTNCPAENQHEFSFPALETPLSSETTEFKIYPIDAMLKLLYTSFKTQIPTFSVTFSRDQLVRELGANATVFAIAEHLVSTGVCSQSDYARVASQVNPSCTRYKASSYKHRRNLSPCKLAALVHEKPVYVQLAVNPYYYQLYSSSKVTCPINRSFYRFTVAGVLTGYNYGATNPYWSLYVQRHGDANRVRMIFDTRFAYGAITSSVFELTANPNIVVSAGAAEEEEEPEAVCESKTISGYIVNNEMDIPDDCFNQEAVNSLQLKSRWPNLKAIRVGKRSFKYVRTFEAIGMDIEKIHLDDDSLSRGNHVSDKINTAAHRTRALSENRKFIVKNCPKLETIDLGEGTCADYVEMTLENLPSLLNIHMGEPATYGATIVSVDNFAFYYADHFSLSSFPKLTNLKLGNSAFYSVDGITISDCPSMRVMEFGAFTCNAAENSVLTMKNLPELNILIMTGSMNGVKTWKAENVCSTKTAQSNARIQVQNENRVCMRGMLDPQYNSRNVYSGLITEMIKKREDNIKLNDVPSFNIGGFNF